MRTAAWVVVAGGVLFVSSARAQPRYRVAAEIRVMNPSGGDPDELFVAPVALTEDDRALSHAEWPQGPGYVAVFHRGQVTVRDRFGSQDVPFGINDLGEIVGEIHDAFDEYDTFPVVWDALGARLLPTGESEWGSYGTATAINDLGDIVGTTSGYGPTLWRDGMPMSLGDLGSPQAINNRGEVVGCGYRSSAGGWRGSLWRDGQVHDLHVGLPGDGQSCARDINDAGVIVGSFQLPLERDRAAVFENGAWRSIHPPFAQAASEATRITGRGAVVGRYGLTGDQSWQWRPFLYENGASWPLQDLLVSAEGVTLTAAVDMNDRGTILAFGRLATGESRALLLDRYTGPAPATSILTPTTGERFRDTVKVVANAIDDKAVTGVQFVVNGRAVHTDSEPPYTREIDLTNYPNGPVTLVVKARDADGNVTTSWPVTIDNQNECAQVVAGQDLHRGFSSTPGKITLRWTGTAQHDLVDGGFGASLGPQTSWKLASAIVLFAGDGTLKARNNTYYTGSLRYRVGENYRFRMEIDVATHKYSVWVRTLNRNEQRVASQVDFRDGRWVTALDDFTARVDAASTGKSIRMCNFGWSSSP